MLLACCREACMSILSFLTRLFEPKLLLSCSPEAATHVAHSPPPPGLPHFAAERATHMVFG